MIIFNSFLLFLLASNKFRLGNAGVVPDGRPEEETSDRHRIVKGDLANPAEIKYIVATLHDGEAYLCGGGIIDNYYVLSAAHCFYDQKFTDTSVSVVAGINDYNNEEDPRRIEVEVEKIFIPKQYSDKVYHHDIALLKLKTSLNIAENDLEKLALPRRPGNLTNRMALMAGFGYDRHKIYINPITNKLVEKGTASGFLRKADIKMVDNTKCQELYPNDDIYDSYLCGKMVKKSQRKEYGVCNGDSGSPLVYKSMVVGVVSWSYGCDERDVPLVYTRVNSFLKFISDAKKGNTADMHVKVFK